MKVILLAAGRSKRIKPIEDKNLILICGKPLIQHIVERLKEAKIKDFLVVCNPFNEKPIREILGAIPQIIFDTVKQIDLDAGMAGALKACEDKIGDEEIMIVSSNDLIEPKAYQLVIEEVKNFNHEVFILGKKVDSYFPGGYLEIDSSRQIKSIIEKPPQGSEPSDLVNLVVHFFRNPIHLFQFLEKSNSRNDDIYELALNRMIKNGVKMKAVIYDGCWYPIKYPWHIFGVASYLFAHLNKTVSKHAQISPKAVVKGEIMIEDGVRIFEGAIVSGPCYLGKNTIIANNTLVRDSFLADSSTVGFGTEIARSIIGKACWFHTNYIGDSIIGDNCSFGSGVRTANLRLDEEAVSVLINGEKISSGSNKLGAIMGNNVRVGINTGIMPGIKIGSGSAIGAGIILAEDVEENMFVRGRWLLKSDPNRAMPDQEKRSGMRARLSKI